MILRLINESDIRAVLNIAIEEKVPMITCSSKIANVHAVMMIVMGSIGDKRKHSQWTELEFISRMIFQAEHHLIKDPKKESKAMQTISHEHEGHSSWQLSKMILTKLANTKSTGCIY